MLSGAFRTLGRAYIDLAAGIFSVYENPIISHSRPICIGSRQTDDGVCCICNLKALTLQLDACQVLLHEVIP